MSLYAPTSRVVPFFHVRLWLFNWLGRALSVATDATEAFFERRQAAPEIARLSDRERRDVGLARSNIGQPVRGRYDASVF